MGSWGISDCSARQRPWRMVPGRSGTHRVHRIWAFSRMGPMPVRTCTVTGVLGRRRTGRSIAKPPPLTSAVRPRQLPGERRLWREQTTGKVTGYLEWRRDAWSEQSGAPAVAGREADLRCGAIGDPNLSTRWRGRIASGVAWGVNTPACVVGLAVKVKRFTRTGRAPRRRALTCWVGVGTFTTWEWAGVSRSGANRQR